MSLLQNDREAYVLGGISKIVSKQLKKLTSKEIEKIKKYFKKANKERFPDRDAWLDESELNPAYDVEDLVKQIEEEYKGSKEFDDIFFVTGSYGEDFALSYDTIDRIIGRKKISKVEGGLLEDDREQYIAGGIASKVVSKILKNTNAFAGRKGKITLKDAKDELKNAQEKVKDLKDSPDRVDELEFYEDVVDELEVKIRMVEEGIPDEMTARGMVAEGGPIDDQMDTLMQSETVPSAVETHTMPDGTEMPGATHEEYEASMSDMESDDVMEDNYMDFILDEALEESEEQYLMEQLEANPELSMIFDKVFDVASEFAGSGPVDGPGSGVSDSIPARLSDGEFVFTTKAVEEIGADNLQQMMEDAEASADQRQPVAYGGYMNGNEDNEYNRRQPLTEEEQLLDMQRANPRRFYRPISG